MSTASIQRIGYVQGRVQDVRELLIAIQRLRGSKLFYNLLGLDKPAAEGGLDDADFAQANELSHLDRAKVVAAEAALDGLWEAAAPHLPAIYALMRDVPR